MRFKVVTVGDGIGEAIEKGKASVAGGSATIGLPCNLDDAEDFVQDTIVHILGSVHKEKLDIGDGIDIAVRRRLFKALRELIRQDRAASVREPHTIPIEEIEETTLCDNSDAWRQRLQPRIDALELKYALVVELYIDGYAKLEIAQMLGLHRDTVTNRLEEAQNQLRSKIPGLTINDIDTGLFDFCSKVTVYRAPANAWESWVDKHPPERRPLRTRKRSTKLESV